MPLGPPVLRGFAHLGEMYLFPVVILVSKNALDLLSYIIGDCAVFFAQLVNFGFWVADDLPFLDKKSHNLRGVSSVGSFIGVESNWEETVIGLELSMDLLEISDSNSL